MTVKEIVIPPIDTRGIISYVRGKAAARALLDADLTVPAGSATNNSTGLFPVNTTHIDALIKQIDTVTNCDALKMLVKQHLEQVKELALAALQNQLDILSRILPILTLPGPNPVAIVKWIAKLVTGTAMPQLEAYIRYISQIIALAQSITNLASAVARAIPRLESCALEIINQTPQDIINQINVEIRDAVNDIQRVVGDNLDAFVDEEGLDRVFTAINDIEEIIADTDTLLSSIDTVQAEINAVIGTGLGQIATTQNLITSITGATPTINTSSTEAFVASIAAGSLTSLKESTEAFTAIGTTTNPNDVPINTVAPAITGTETVGSTLTCSTGTWTSNSSVTYTYQWQYARTGTLLVEETNSNYVVDLEDKGKSLNCIVTATNASGSNSINSNSTSVIP